MLTVAACSQPRIGQVPVINGSAGESIKRGTDSVPSLNVVTVQHGDSLYRIANRYGVRLRGLIDVNKLAPPYIIFPGQKLKLPTIDAHIATRGETIYQIARRYKTEPGTLVRINRLRPPYRLSPGQKVILPKGLAQIAKRPSDTGVRSTTRQTTNKRTSRNRNKARANQKRLSAERALTLGKDPVKAGPKTSRLVQPPSLNRSGFIWPVSGRLLSKFGSLGKGLQNDGINILARRGAPVRAIQNGVVAYAGNELRGFGNLILVKHSGRWISAYAHNDQ
jgi:murein DD-endopeptidase MepM/ murein hydrolase activator NlpD